MKKFFFTIIKMAVMFFIFIYIFAGCTNKYKSYYTDKENYVTASGTVSFIDYSDDKSELYIAFDNLSYDFSDNCFKIMDSNLKIISDKNIDTYLDIGTVVTFTSAPGYFGDGYVMPIVAISIDGIEFLSFEEGFENLSRIYS